MLKSGENIAGYEVFENWEEAGEKLHTDLEVSLQNLQAIRLKIEQSQGEVTRLAKRNASVTAHLQQVQAQLDSTSKVDIRSAYETALDTLQRLFVMRGQLEKLQIEQEGLSKHVQMLQALTRLAGQGMDNKPGSANSFSTVEMMIQAQEAERQRLSRKMHDGPAQALSNFILQTEIATRLFDIDQSKAREELRVLKTAATTTFQQVRDFIFELRPMMLDDLGLVPTIKRYVDAIGEQAGMDLRLTVTGSERRLESYMEVVIFRSVQELVHNATHHSQGSEVRVQLDIPDNEVRVTVEDNGKGFDTKVAESPKSIGLKLIKERVDMLGGLFEIDSNPTNGTRVFFRIPLSRQADFA